MTRLPALFALLLAFGYAHAAEFKCMQRFGDHSPEVRDAIKGSLGLAPAPSSCTSILLSGSIAPGDVQRLRETFRDSGGLLSTINLNSPGGDIREAMELGRYIRRTLLSTNAPMEYAPGDQFYPPLGYRGWNPCKQGTCICASACFVVWAAGIKRTGHALAVHRPRFDPAYFSGLDHLTAQREYTNALTTLSRYFDEMGVPAAYYDQMVSISSAEIHALSKPEAEALWTTDYPPAIDEWLISKCGAFPASSLDALLRSGAQAADGRTSSVSDEQRERLLNTWGQIGACRSRVLIQSRRAIFKDLPSVQ